MMPKKPRLNAYHEHVAQSLKKKKMKNAIKTKTNNFDFTSDESSSDESDKFMAINSVGSSVNNWDEFCWKCHKLSYGEVCCSKCVLSFHAGCVADSDRNSADWLCPECQTPKGGFIDNELVKCFVERIILYADFKDSMDDLDCSLLVKPLNHLNIIEKAKQNIYRSVEAIMVDFKWLLHNWTILCGQKKGSVKPPPPSNKRSAENLLNICKAEQLDLEKCTDCYINRQRTDAFKLVCSKPHLLIWARYSGYPYWPAKVMDSPKKYGPKALLVHFFGDHTSAHISPKDAYLFSKEDPNTYCQDSRTQDFINAVQEAQLHINNIEKNFGAFHFAALATPVKVGNIDMEHLEMQMPGFRNPSLRPKHVSPVHNNHVDEIPQMPELVSENDKPKDLTINWKSKDIVPNVNVNLPKLPFSEIDELSNRVEISPAIWDKLRHAQEYINALHGERENYIKQIAAHNRLNQKYREEISQMEEKIKEAKLKQCVKCFDLLK